MVPAGEALAALRVFALLAREVLRLATAGPTFLCKRNLVLSPASSRDGVSSRLRFFYCGALVRTVGGAGAARAEHRGRYT